MDNQYFLIKDLDENEPLTAEDIRIALKLMLDKNYKVKEIKPDYPPREFLYDR